MRSFVKILAAAAATMLIATGCNVVRGDQSAGEYVDDATLTARVKAALLDDDKIDGTQINVNVFDGKVTLDGRATSEEERQRAVQIAQQVPGVRGVQNTIRVAEAETAEQQQAEQEQQAEQQRQE